MKKSPNAFKLLIAGIIDLLLCIFLDAIIGAIALTNLTFWSYTLYYITSALIIPAYFILITYYNNGRTVGKAVFGLKIFSDLTSKITIKQALKRDGTLLLPASIYLAWHLPYIDNHYDMYEALKTNNYQKLGGFIVQDDISKILFST
ncbi:MAG: RDD family protein, partial [Candidatus Paceibacterota bacterium]